MEYASLGGLTVSRLAFGCAQMGGFDYGKVDDAESIAAVHAALDAGVTLFDVADVYGLGHAEEVLGRALRGKRAVIATKIGLSWESGNVVRDLSAAYVTRAIDASLRRLGVDSIDLLQLHWPDASTPVDETADALARCIEAGKIRFAGCSNFSASQVAALHARVPVIAVQAAYNLMCREIERELVAWCVDNAIGVLAHSTLARGLLARKYELGTTFGGTDTRTNSRYFDVEHREEKVRVLDALSEIARRRGVSEANVAVRWVLDSAGITSAIVGIRNSRQLEDQMRAFGWRLAADELALLNDASARCPGVLDGSLATAKTNDILRALPQPVRSG